MAQLKMASIPGSQAQPLVAGLRRSKYAMNVDDLLYAPLARPQMTTDEYLEKLAILDEADKAVTQAVKRLSEAASALSDEKWKGLPVPGHRPPETIGGRKLPTPKVTEWQSLDDIKKLAEAYWTAFADAEAGWNALSPIAKQGNVRQPGKARF